MKGRGRRIQQHHTENTTHHTLENTKLLRPHLINFGEVIQKCFSRTMCKSNILIRPSKTAGKIKLETPF